MFQDPFILSVLLALAAVTGVFFGVPRLRRSGCAATTGMKVAAPGCFVSLFLFALILTFVSTGRGRSFPARRHSADPGADCIRPAAEPDRNCAGPARARSHARPETRRNDLLFLLHASVPDSARHSLSMLLPLCRSREINVFSGFSKLFSNIFRKSFEKSD